MTEFTQGICQDGAAILRDGVPMTIEQILEGLRGNELALKIADESSASLLHCNLTWVADAESASNATPPAWMDIRTPGPEDDQAINEAVEYLELRGLLERHPSKEGLVRVIKQERERS